VIVNDRNQQRKYSQDLATSPPEAVDLVSSRTDLSNEMLTAPVGRRLAAGGSASPQPDREMSERSIISSLSSQGRRNDELNRKVGSADGSTCSNKAMLNLA